MFGFIKNLFVKDKHIHCWKKNCKVNNHIFTIEKQKEIRLKQLRNK
jgi:hypothetical protein